MKTLNRKTLDKFLFFKISGVNLSVSISDFQSVIRVNNPEAKTTIYKHKRYKIEDLATILEIKVHNSSLFGITRGKQVYLVYDVLTVGIPERILPFEDRITDTKLYKNYIFYEKNLFLQIDLERL